MTHPLPVSLLIVGPHPVVRDGLARLIAAERPRLHITAIGPAELAGVVSAQPPAAAIVDLTGDDGAALRGASALWRADSRTIALVREVGRPIARAAMRVGARGLVAADAPLQVVLASVDAAIAGRYWIGDHSLADRESATRELRRRTPLAPLRLTPREVEVLAQVAEGRSNREIADALAVTEDTIKHKVSQIFDKTGASNRVELSAFAAYHGLLDVPDPSAGHPPPAPPAGVRSVLLIDRSTISRSALRAIIETRPDLLVAGEAADAVSGLAAARALGPDLILFDVPSLAIAGEDPVADLRAAARGARLLAVVDRVDRAQIVSLVRRGVRGVVARGMVTTLFLHCLEVVSAGEVWVGRRSVSDLADELVRLSSADRPRTDRLTARERQILALASTGASNKEIGRRCALCEDTVKHYLTSIFHKTGVSGRAALARLTSRADDRH